MSTASITRIDVGRACTNACLFCAQAGRSERTTAVLETLESLPTEAERIYFVGGEPSRHADFELWIEAARVRGVKHVGVQSNGAELGSERLAALKAAGLTELELTLHGPKAEVHDYLTATPGSFACVVEALSAARVQGLEVRTASALMRSNFRHAAELVDFVATHGVKAHVFVVARVAGRARANMPRLIPRLAMALPCALRAAVVGENVGVEVAIVGAPLCMLGPHVGRALPSPPQHQPDACAACSQRASCPGLDATYVERFGSEEISAERARGRVRHPATRVARFAGIGPMTLP